MSENKTTAVDCTVYGCAKQDEMYIYIRDGFDIAELPEGLDKLAGELREVMALSLTPERKLARVEVSEVIAALNEQGFFIQMPPGPLNAKVTYGE